MSETPFQQFYWPDYWNKTGHMTCEEHGAYLQLLGRMWGRGGFLPNDPAQLARMCALPLRRWAKVGPTVMAMLTVENGQVTHPRVLEDLRKATAKSQLRSLAGERGGRAKALKSRNATVANASVLPKHSPEPDRGSVSNETGETAPPELEPKAEPPKAPETPNPNKEAWDRALTLLLAAGVRQAAARSFFGRLLSTNRLEARDLLASIVAAELKATSDPQAYLSRAARAVSDRRGQVSQADRSPLEIVASRDPDEWRACVGIFAEKGAWPPHWGPKPGEAGCKAPPEAQRAFGFLPAEAA